MNDELMKTLNDSIMRVNNILEVAENYSLDHDYAISGLSCASRIHETWKQIVEKMLKDPSYKPDLSKIQNVEW